jgi:cation diffusion facilitator family transporter
MQNRGTLTRYAWLSVITAIGVIALKITAYTFTGSIGFLSDALESGANIVAAIITLVALLVAARPPDREHEYGHSKAEYISSATEGTLIFLAAIYIAYQAVQRLLSPQPLEQIGVGVLISAIAALANFLVARVLLSAGERHRSMALTADAKHLMTDVWTSAGVIVGVSLAGLTGWLWLDPVIALLVSVQIIITGTKLVRESIDGLMDAALPADEIEVVTTILNQACVDGVAYHALRTRRSGSQRFISVHIQVPGGWSVQQGHELLETIEREIRRALPPVNIITHLEPVEDPVSWQDALLNRAD